MSMIGYFLIGLVFAGVFYYRSRPLSLIEYGGLIILVAFWPVVFVMYSLMGFMSLLGRNESQ